MLTLSSCVGKLCRLPAMLFFFVCLFFHLMAEFVRLLEWNAPDQSLFSLLLWQTLVHTSVSFLLQALMDEITSAADELICCVGSLNGASREIILSPNFHWLRGQHAKQVLMRPISRQDAFLCKVVPPGGQSCCQKCWCCFVTGTFSFGIHPSGQGS